MIQKVLLAANDEATEVLAKLRYPVWAFPKLDGIRGFVHEGVVYSRNLKPLANCRLQETFGWSKYEGYDGEFILGDPTDPKVFSRTSSVVSALDRPVEGLKFHVFDYRDWEPSTPYYERQGRLMGDNLVEIVDYEIVYTETALLEYEEKQLAAGYEGLILRDPLGRYKYGRSTLNEGILLKLKRFADDEAVVIGFEERYHNANEKTLVKNGKEVRNSRKEGMVPLGTLGALVVSWRGVEFRIGTGFDAAEAQNIWDNRDKFLHKTVTFKYFNYGVVSSPRHPVFLHFREKWDL